MNISSTIFQGTANTAALSITNGDTLNLFPTGYILATGAGVSPGVQAAGSNVFNISGDIFSTQYFGIDVTTGGSVFNIGSTATIFGSVGGINVNGAGNVFTNAGDIGSQFAAVSFNFGSTTFSNSGNIISANRWGVLFAGGANTITNTGYISGRQEDGIQFSGNNNNVFNFGTLTGDSAVDFDSPGGVNALFNAGTMIGTNGFGYDGSDVQDLIVNNGLIQGTLAAVDLMGAMTSMTDETAQSWAPFWAVPAMTTSLAVLAAKTCKGEPATIYCSAAGAVTC